MKIIFKIIRSKTGSDTYYRRLVSALVKNGIEAEIIYYPNFFQYLPVLIKLFDKFVAADIIHSDIEYGWVFKNNRQPLVLTAHHSVFDKNYQAYTTWPQKIFHHLFLRPNITYSFKTADKVIAVSNYTAKSFCRTFGKFPIKTIYNTIDTNIFKPSTQKTLSSKKLQLLAVGNPSVRKGSDLLPSIMLKLGNDYVLRYTNGLRNDPFPGNLANMISLGRISHDQLIKEYQHCDALIFPTRLEGFGYAAAEAMACGKPVVTTNYSSLPEIVTNQKAGFLCRLNDIDDFVAKIKFLKSHPAIAQKMGKQGRQQILQKFNQKKWAQQYQTIYESL